MKYLLDTHFHLEFIEDFQHQTDFLEQISKEQLQIVAQTMTPTSFNKLLDRSSRWRRAIQPLNSLGFHPWRIQSEQHVENELKILKDVIHQTPFIGEIGLDFSPKRMINTGQNLQMWTFSEIITSTIKASLQSQQAYTLSIHAVQSVTEVIEILEELNAYQDNIHLVLHRFGGTSDELTRHIRNGGYISIHPQMLKTKKGRAYVKQIPEDRILLETDLPEFNHDDQSVTTLSTHVKEVLIHMICTLSHIRNQSMRPIVQQTQQKLYGYSIKE